MTSGTPGAARDDLLNVWEFDRASDPGWATRAVQDGLIQPAFQVALVSSRGDSITVQLFGAKAPSGDPDAVYYVEGRGAYVLERVEEWPALPDETKKRFLLVLKAWPAK